MRGETPATALNWRENYGCPLLDGIFTVLESTGGAGGAFSTPGLVIGSHKWGFHGLPKALIDIGEGKKVPWVIQS